MATDNKSFVHLHVHTQYSLLDGQASIPALVDKAMADGMPGIAITDHGNMYGIKEFFNYVNKKNSKLEEGQKFKPIFGCEVYVAEKDLHEHVDKRDIGRHLILLAKNRQGYKNLIKIVSKAWTEGFYMHPRTDKQEIAAHHEGLIVCSACLGGELPKLLVAGDIEGADSCVRWWKELMGDDYYIELQRHKAAVPRANHEAYELQMRIEPELIRLARKYDVKLVCTNDVHFTNESDAEAHDRLICLSTNKYVNDDDRMLYSKQEWMKSTDEMRKLFADIPEALDNTLEVLSKIETYDIDHAPIMPFFEIPKEFGTEEEYRSRITEQELFDEFTRDENGNVVLSQEEAEKKIKKLGGYDKLYRIKFEADYLAKLAYEGAEKRYGSPLTPELRERIKFELHIMKTMGFPGYFLIVQDFINHSREVLGVSVGPGRGSAAGSCVAYCLGITQIDPVKYDLLFERFLNPDRISLPDIDVDFDDDGRAIVLRYVTEKYGAEKVAHIITYGTMAAKSAIKDVARVEQLPLPESNRLAKLIPAHMPEVNGKELKPTLKNCYEYVDDFKRELNSPDPLLRETLQYAKALEGNVRNTGVHACGVIICRDDITDWVPVSTANDKDEGKLLVTQYEGRVIEETGLIKMDFLGLKTLSILKEAVANIRQTRGIEIDLEKIPIDDPKTYKLYTEGRTVGTFQFESAGMQKYLRELKPSTFEDLIAMNALYRPGPMDYIPEFIRRKHGESPIVYDIPEMEKYLKDTYGVTVYQEQVMLLSRLLANFTRGESDTLRKAMGKKLIDKMNHLKGKFLEGGQATGHDPKVLEKIWADWEKFASYAFNKSHATCYSWVAFQTAYLKANYPSEYMAAVLSRNIADQAKLTVFMDECRAMKIQVLGPDVNESFSSFSVNKKGDIRFGLGAVKGVGGNVVQAIVDARGDRPFTDIYDFVERIPQGSVNRRTMDNLAMAGAFDGFDGIKREDFFAENHAGVTFSEQLLNYGASYHRHANDSMGSLFGDDFGAELNTQARPPVKPAQSWPDIDRLTKERDLVGMYLSAHPLDPYYMELHYGCKTTVAGLKDIEPQEGMEVTYGGMIASFERRPTKRGGTFGIVRIEDETGSTEFRLFGDDVFKLGQYCVPMTPVMVTCRFQRRFRDSDIELKPVNIQLLSNVKGHLIKGITLDVTPDAMNDALLSILKEQMKPKMRNASDDGAPQDSVGFLSFRVYDPAISRSVSLTSSLRIPINRHLLDSLRDLEIPYSVATV
ncbi:MAG: DNA polymerase III subunit alpha [Muribaculaceae bacterium]|nr:DNA polymerase III subunit alpha [Muribaculaceae bacterium]